MWLGQRGLVKVLIPLLQVLMEVRDYAGLVQAALRYGDTSRGGDPTLWGEVLHFLVLNAHPPSSTPVLSQQQQGGPSQNSCSTMAGSGAAGADAVPAALESGAQGATGNALEDDDLASEDGVVAYKHLPVVLEHIERRGVLPPLVVLQTLARNETLPLSLVKAYVHYSAAL